MLGTIHRSGTVSSLMNLQNEMTKYPEHLETRTYTPRILEELFNTITSANLDKVLSGVQNIESEENLDESA